MYLRKAITLQTNSCHNLDPLNSNDLHKLSEIQIHNLAILIYHFVVKVKKYCSLEFSKLSLKVASAYMLPQSSDSYLFTKSTTETKTPWV